MSKEIIKRTDTTLAEGKFFGQIVPDNNHLQGISLSSETPAMALATRSEAEIKARFYIAQRKPRDMDDVRVKLLRACERPGFAGSATEKIWGAAWFLKPIGDGIEGFSIRFAEEAMRAMGNMDARSSIIWENDTSRIILVEVLDLENNISIPTTINIEKTVERTYLKKGEMALSARTNSQGKPVYLRIATEDELMAKQNSAISKAMRNGILRLLPGDIQAECRERILEIRNGDSAADPDAAKKKIADSFAAHNIKPSDLKEYLGHDIATASPVEISTLRDLYQAFKNGETTWSDVITAIREERGQATTETENDGQTNSPVEKLKKRLSKKEEPEKNIEQKQKKNEEQQNQQAQSVAPYEFDAIAEVKEIAQKKFGNKASELLRSIAIRHGISDIDQITQEQASMMIDVLNSK